MTDFYTILYIVLGLVVAVLVYYGYRIYTRYQSMKAVVLNNGIPAPPMDTFQGHLQFQFSALKHEASLQLCDQVRYPMHQLVWMTLASVYVNDDKLAGKILSDLKDKGGAYYGSRMHPQLADLFTSGYSDWKLKHDSFGDTMNALVIDSKRLPEITKDLLFYLNKCAESGEEINLTKLCTLFALDMLCEIALDYQLDAVKEMMSDSMGSASSDLKLPKNSWGEALYQIIDARAERRAGSGKYPNPNARVIPQEEISLHTARLMQFLEKMYNNMKTLVSTKATKNPFILGLMQYASTFVPDNEDQCELKRQGLLISEIYQILRHGEEALSGQLLWCFVCLHRNPRARMELEISLQADLAKTNNKKGSTDYLEATLKEVLRKYPIMGNMTGRAVDKEVYVMKGADGVGHKVPLGTPVFVPMFALQNTNKTWTKPRDFSPERWLPQDLSPKEAKEAKDLYPSCPFGFGNAKAKHASVTENMAYAGSGFNEEGLSYFPFGAGERRCPALGFSLQIMRQVLYDVCSKYRFDVAKELGKMYTEVGGSINHYTIVPLFKEHTVVKAEAIKMEELGINYKVLDKAKQADEGWADYSDDEQEDVEMKTTFVDLGHQEDYNPHVTGVASADRQSPMVIPGDGTKVDQGAETDASDDDVPDLVD